MLEGPEVFRIDRIHGQKDLCFGKTWASARYVTELGNVITSQPDAGRRLDFFSFQQNAELFITDLRAFLKRYAIRSSEHQCRYDKRDTGCLLSCFRNCKIEPARAILYAFESQITDVLLWVL